MREIHNVIKETQGDLGKIDVHVHVFELFLPPHIYSEKGNLLN